MKNKWLWADNFKYTEVDYGSCVLPFLSLSSIYKPSFISISLLLYKIIHYEKWLRGDNSINI